MIIVLVLLVAKYDHDYCECSHDGQYIAYLQNIQFEENKLNNKESEISINKQKKQINSELAVVTT